jgi:iron-sulfur cluster assembly protein
MFTISPTAAEQILRAAETQVAEDAEGIPVLPMLRLAAKVDDDGELAYGMGFDEEHDDDISFESAGVTVLIAPHSEDLLKGATLDFVELNPGEFQFIFINPNEPLAGGCGSGGCGAGGCGSSGARGGCG